MINCDGVIHAQRNLIIALDSSVGAQHMDAYFNTVALLKWNKSCVLP